MRLLQIDFAPRGMQRILYAAPPLQVVLAVAGLLLCVSGVLTMTWLGRASVESRTAGAQLAAQRQALPETRQIPAQPLAISEEQAEGINATIRRLNLPWSALLDAVEKATPSSVALMSLEPDAKRNVVKAVAEARSPEQMADYIFRLKQQPFFGHVVLTHHEITGEEARPNGKGGEPVKPVRFEIEVQWREPVR